jgi:hypothetical protein
MERASARDLVRSIPGGSERRSFVSGAMLSL